LIVTAVHIDPSFVEYHNAPKRSFGALERWRFICCLLPLDSFSSSLPIYCPPPPPPPLLSRACLPAEALYLTQGKYNCTTSQNNLKCLLPETNTYINEGAQVEEHPPARHS
ncbi:hypothetical protein KUCAC02_000895, partial [Chaenocephalus aceratus]